MTNRILVVDDYEPFRRFITSTLSTQPRLRIIGEASDGLEAVKKADDLRPDLILLDVGLPNLNGIQAARRIRQLSPDTKILFVSMESSPDVVQSALDTGALGYVVKSAAAGELVAAVEAVLRGRLFISSRLAGHDLVHPEDEHKAGQQSVLAPFPLESSEDRHQLRLYSNDAAFVGDFAHSIEAALENGNAVLVVATELHRANLLEQLRTDGVDIDMAAERKLYVSISVPDSPATNGDRSRNKDEIGKGVPPAVLEALRAAKERHLRLAMA